MRNTVKQFSRVRHICRSSHDKKGRTHFKVDATQKCKQCSERLPMLLLDARYSIFGFHATATIHNKCWKTYNSQCIFNDNH